MIFNSSWTLQTTHCVCHANLSKFMLAVMILLDFWKQTNLSRNSDPYLLLKNT